MRKMARAFSLGLAALCLMALVPIANAQETASVYIIHGIPGRDVSPSLDPALPVDVLVNNSICLLKGFQFGEVEGPFTLPVDTYNIKISLANTLTPCANSPVMTADVPFAFGENASVIAHLTDVGVPTASKFSNDLGGTDPGGGRIIVHHTAKAPAVDISVRRGFLEWRRTNNPGLTIPNFSNGGQAGAEVLAGTWRVTITLNGSTTPVFGPANFQVKPFTAHLVFAVGAVDSGSFTLLVKDISNLGKKID